MKENAPVLRIAMRFKSRYINFLWLVLILSTTFFFIFVILYALDKDATHSQVHNDLNEHFRVLQQNDFQETTVTPSRVSTVNPLYEFWGNANTNFTRQDLALLNNDTTIVTAYFRLGKFQKGETETFTPKLYRTWFTVFSRIESPVVAYFDNDDDAGFFKFIRERVTDHPTKIVKVVRDDMWAFSLQPRIERIFSQSWYPKHHPNTVKASYSCAMHAKYELMRRSVVENPYQTLYVAWLDIGLFRQLTSDGDNPAVQKDQRRFRMSLPPDFDPRAIAYGQVFPVSRRLRSPMDIIGYNAVWVCGCYFVGRVDKMFDWTREYMGGVERMLQLDLMSTDQQVLYWMKTNHLIKSRIQLYSEEGAEGDYFYLGYRSAVALKSKTQE